MLELSHALDLVAKAEMEENEEIISQQEAIQILRNSVYPDEVASWRESFSQDEMSDELWLSYVYVSGVSLERIQAVWPDYQDL